ncbi:MAG TPA: hypothetical protein VN513_08890 [Gemmatimonadales bacterium]|nr:hypothetical protein [Gemmatimonadales bacterium]
MEIHAVWPAFDCPVCGEQVPVRGDDMTHGCSGCGSAIFQDSPEVHVYNSALYDSYEAEQAALDAEDARLAALDGDTGPHALDGSEDVY